MSTASISLDNHSMYFADLNTYLCQFPHLLAQQNWDRSMQVNKWDHRAETTEKNIFKLNSNAVQVQ